LTWTATDSTSCTASGGNWSGSVSTSGGTASVLLDETTTYTLTCTGAGGTTSQTATVTATAAAATSGKSGGGSIDPTWLLLGTGLLVARLRRDHGQRVR
jgi:hypothetical protein